MKKMGPKDAREHYLAAFARFARDLSGNGRSWISELRQEAIGRFEELGFPTTRDEAWRYTSVTPITGTPFTLRTGARTDALTPKVFEQLTFEPWECSHLVFVNGRFAAELSQIRALPRGVEVGSLAEALVSRRGVVEPHLGRLADFRDHAFTALNTAFMLDGAFVHVPRGVVVEEPIHLLFVSAPDGGPVVSHPPTGSSTTTSCSASGRTRTTSARCKRASGAGRICRHTSSPWEGI
jgi:Fe-S cluster assembly protein SufD